MGFLGLRLALLTSTPLNITQGSGTFSGITTLARAVRAAGAEVELIAPPVHLPVYTLERLWFNEQLRRRDFHGFDAVVGFDMDGYRIAGQGGPPHAASIKGVIADEMRFEHGATRATMTIQATCERIHVRRADLVMTTSQYAARQLQALYGLAESPRVVPEAIDLALWHELFARNPAEPDPHKFTVLSICRFYPRKRLDVLLGAAARVRDGIPELEVRIVGGGPEAGRLRRICRELRLGRTVRWLGDVSQAELACEYQRADLFCLPSVQEGFGIVFLEAMAAGKPIIAARAAAVPELVPQGILVEPGDELALAASITKLYNDAALRRSLGEAGQSRVEQFEASRIAKCFLEQIDGLTAGRTPSRTAAQR